MRTDWLQGETEQGIRDLTEATGLEWREPGGRMWQAVGGRWPNQAFLAAFSRLAEQAAIGKEDFPSSFPRGSKGPGSGVRG